MFTKMPVPSSKPATTVVRGRTSTCQWNSPGGRDRAARYGPPRCTGRRRWRHAGRPARRATRPRRPRSPRPWPRRSGRGSTGGRRACRTARTRRTGSRPARARRRPRGRRGVRRRARGHQIRRREALDRSLDRGRHDVERDDLRVRMRDRCARRLALVHERLHVRVPGVEVEADAIADDGEHLGRRRVGERAERCVVVGGEDHDLVRTGRRASPNPDARRFVGRAADDRVEVRDDAHPPALGLRPRPRRCGAPPAASSPRGRRRTGSRRARPSLTPVTRR